MLERKCIKSYKITAALQWCHEI